MCGSRTDYETPLTLNYWRQRGGTLIEEFQLVKPVGTGPPDRRQGCRCVDGLIFPEVKTVRLRSETTRGRNSRLDFRKLGFDDKGTVSEMVKDNHIVIVQSKNARLGLCLLGQALFGKALAEDFEFKPSTVDSVAVFCGGHLELVELLGDFDIIPHVVEGSRKDEDERYAGFNHQLIDDYLKIQKKQGLLIRNFPLRAGQIAYALFLTGISPAQYSGPLDYSRSDSNTKERVKECLAKQRSIRLLTTRVDKPRRSPGMCVLGHAQLASFLLAKDYPKAVIKPIVPCRSPDAALERVITAESYKHKLKEVNENVEAVRTKVV